MFRLVNCIKWKVFGGSNCIKWKVFGCANCTKWKVFGWEGMKKAGAGASAFVFC